MEHQLLDGYIVKDLSAEKFNAVFDQYHHQVFAKTFAFNEQAVLTEAENAAANELRSRFRERFALRLGVYHEGEIVGWHVGLQDNWARFYMMNTGVLPAHQRHGIYTALLPYVIERVKNEGFQYIYSRHHPTNNAVIIPKLKAGFHIVGFEITDTHGTLVHLAYYFNPTRRKAIQIRVGELIPDAEMRSHFNL